jgi:hypothetical protein
MMETDIASDDPATGVPRYDRDFLLSPAKRNQIVKLWEVEFRYFGVRLGQHHWLVAAPVREVHMHTIVYLTAVPDAVKEPLTDAQPWNCGGLRPS